METQGSAWRRAPLWLRIAASVVLLPGFWTSVLFAAIALLPASLFPRLQIFVQVVSLLPAAALAWLTVRRAPTLLLAILIPVLLVLYILALNLMAKLPVALEGSLTGAGSGVRPPCAASA